MARRSSILGFVAAFGLITAIALVLPLVLTRSLFLIGYFFLILTAIAVAIIGGAITRNSKAGAVVGFLTVWIPTLAAPLSLLRAVGNNDIGFGGVLFFGMVSLAIAALGALVGGIAGYLNGRKWLIKTKWGVGWR